MEILREPFGEPIPERRLRRLVETTVRYLLRWTTRATPFGTFAGVAPVEFGPRAAVRWGEAHHAAARPDEKFIAQHTALAERDLATLRTVAVVTNSLGHPRGDLWVLPCARAERGRVWDVEIDLTGPVRLAVQSAASPIMFGNLAARVAETLPAGTAAAEQLLAALVEARVLLSVVRPPMTVTAPAAYLARHRGRTLGLGATVAGMLLVPGLNLIALGIGAVGATLADLDTKAAGSRAAAPR